MKKSIWLLIFSMIAVVVIWVVSSQKNTSLSGGRDTASDTSSPQEETSPNHLTTSDKPLYRNYVDQTQFIDQPDPQDSRVTRTADGYNIYNPSYQSSQQLSTITDTAEFLTIIKELLGNYRFIYNENPIAESNTAVIASLTGKNPKKVIFMDPNITSITNGELVDIWKTPYVFHALSGENMEIRSAGPDRIMWTDDDITTE